jgi:hypothetical protein
MIQAGVRWPGSLLVDLPAAPAELVAEPESSPERVEKLQMNVARRKVAPAVAERIRRRTPPDSFVLPGSLPVVSFGDPNRAVTATLSLNPSWREFESSDGTWLGGSRRRLASLISLGAADSRDLNDEQVSTVLAQSESYFDGPNWYRGWFHWLESMLNTSGAGSYFDGTACHLDLVQWATKPAQGELPVDVWRHLVEEDRDFLRWQLANTNVRVLLLNGASVAQGLQEAGLVDEFETNVIPYEARNGSAKLRVYRANADGVAILGWNRPLAGALSGDGRLKLGSWLSDALQTSRMEVDALQLPARGQEATMWELESGYVPSASVVQGASELERLLAHWFAESDRPTVGDVGNFGGSPLITVRLGADEFFINRDTKRAAIHTFLTAAHQSGGADQLPWRVTTNARGAVNRVTYRTDDAPTPGWYAYVRGTSDPRDLR